MRQVGTRVEQAITERASGAMLVQGALFIEALSKLSPAVFNIKGVYRYKSHDEADRHELDHLVEGMGQLAAKRAR